MVFPFHFSEKNFKATFSAIKELKKLVVETDSLAEQFSALLERTSLLVADVTQFEKFTVNLDRHLCDPTLKKYVEEDVEEEKKTEQTANED